MTIEDFLRLLLRNLLLLVAGLVLGAAAGYGLSFTQSTTYSASALGYVSASAQSDENGDPIQQASGNMQFQYSKAQSYLPLFNTRAVGQRIVDELGLEASPDEVAGSLQTTLDPNAPIITVEAVAPTAEEASAIANAAVEATAAEARSLETGGNENAAVGVQLTNYQNAVVPGAPVSPDREKFLIAGAAFGLLVALGLAWLRDRNDSRLRTADDVTDVVGLPTLGALPDAKEFARGKDGVLPEPAFFPSREALRKLRTNLRYIDVDNPPRSIVVTSSAPGEGKSTVASNLARVMARAGQPTLLVDADLRRPMIAQQFSVDGEVGLSQLLAASVSLEDVAEPTTVPLLTLLPAGQIPPNPSELLGSRRMQELIEELSRQYFVIIDAPPVLAVTDAQLLTRHSDGAILVAVPGQTRTAAMQKAVEAIRAVNGTVYGAVLNRASTGRLNRLAYGDAVYGYSAYGKYGYGALGGYDESAVVPDAEEVDVEQAGGPAEPGPASAPAAAVAAPDAPRPADTEAPRRAAQASPRPEAQPVAHPARAADESAPVEHDENEPEGDSAPAARTSPRGRRAAPTWGR
ncbi:polysaccharide biosynthesis tyrosine autokinase [Brachybacterium atlanticum]|uniref:polysaccharide biosynthesis tyrosine autokinase n=1 Tax=Brachybacterium atlanticum TaxID=2911888 RepID=UPI0021E0EFF3|nr:polysaccharide biosynthesis tyrosine autokinase [Brachybacterium atlanticum]